MRNLHANWEPRHYKIFQELGIQAVSGYVNIPEDEQYFLILGSLNDAPNFRDKRTFVIFNENELQLSEQFLLLRGFPSPTVYPYESSDSIDYKTDVFGETCSNCRIPLNEQVNPFTLTKDVNFPSSKFLYFTINWANNYLFTDKERYDKILKNWGFGYREVLIGKKKKVSDKIIQLEIPLSPFPLKFGQSEFGKKFAQDGSGLISEQSENCPLCHRPLFTNSLLDYFPAFTEEFDFNLVHTQEWFGWYHHLVISRKFAEFLVQQKVIKWDSTYLIPVKQF
jgi:hypothetical protein